MTFSADSADSADSNIFQHIPPYSNIFWHIPTFSTDSDIFWHVCWFQHFPICLTFSADSDIFWYIPTYSVTFCHFPTFFRCLRCPENVGVACWVDLIDQVAKICNPAISLEQNFDSEQDEVFLQKEKTSKYIQAATHSTQLPRMEEEIN